MSGQDGSGADAGGVEDGAPSGDGRADASEDEAGTPGFRIETPEIDVAPGTDSIACAYLRVPTTASVAVKSWKSTKSAGVVHAALIFTDSDKKPPGTVSDVDCTMFAGTPTPTWIYSAFKALDGWSFPADDGTGKPVAKIVKADQPAYVLMHLVNPDSSARKVKVAIEAAGYPAGTAVTRAESFVTYNGDISVGAGATNDLESNTCPTPAGAKLVWASTLSRKASVKTALATGGSTFFTSTNREDPGSAALPSKSPFKAFTDDMVTIECTYANPTGATIAVGELPSDEVCTMLSYVFPATAPRRCYNTVLLP